MTVGASAEDIGDEDNLYRRLIPTSVNRQGIVVASAFYARGMLPDLEISVDLARLSTIDQSLARGRPGDGLGQLRAGAARGLGLEVRHAPDATTENEAHALIIGATTKEQCRLLARATVALIRPGQQP